MFTDMRHGSCAAFNDSLDGLSNLVDYIYPNSGARFKMVKADFKVELITDSTQCLMASGQTFAAV